MRLSVGEALASGRLVGVNLVAGRIGMHKVITRLKILRSPDQPGTIPPNSIVLLHDENNQTLPTTLVNLIQLLGPAGTSALMVRDDMITHDAMCAADEFELPLLSVHDDQHWNGVIDSLQRDLLLVQIELYERVQEIHNTLTHVVVDGHGLDEIARVLANLVHNPVVIEDHRFEVLAWHNDGTEPDSVRKRVLEGRKVPADVLDVLAQKGVLQRINTEKKPFHVPPISQLNMQARVMAPILVGNIRYGHISISESNRPLGELDLMAIEQAATLVTLQLSLLRSVKEREERLEESLVYDIIFNHDQAEASIRQRANFLGYTFADRYVVIIIDIDCFSEAIQTHGWRESTIQNVKEMMKRQIRESFFTNRQSTLVASSGDAFMLLYPLGEQDSLDVVKGYAKRAQKMLLDVLPQLTFSAGIGRTCTQLREVAQSYRDAQTALSVGRASRGNNAITAYDQLGLYSLLVRFADERLLKSYVENTIGPLIAYDAEHNTELLKTLRCYLLNSENKSQTATDLYVHVNTVKYRLQKICDIIGIDLDDPDDVIDLQLCLKFTDVVAWNSDEY